MRFPGRHACDSRGRTALPCERAPFGAVFPQPPARPSAVFGDDLDACLFEGTILPCPEVRNYRPGGLNALLSAPADLNAFIASLLVIATAVLRWEIPPDAAPAISAEPMTFSLGASLINNQRTAACLGGSAIGGPMGKLITASARPLSRLRIGKGQRIKPAGKPQWYRTPFLKCSGAGTILHFRVTKMSPLSHWTKPTLCSIGVRKRLQARQIRASLLRFGVAARPNISPTRTACISVWKSEI